jgi:putative membrane protein
MSASMVVIWTLVIWGIVTVARGSNTSTGERGAGPERSLAERFAAGDIDADEYRQRHCAAQGTDRASMGVNDRAGSAPLRQLRRWR